MDENTIFVVYTRFEKAGYDHTPAKLVSRLSYDRGETWTDERIIVSNTNDVLNVMSASLIRLSTGGIGLIYLIKETLTNCYPVIQISNNNGRTFSEPISIIESGTGYFTLNNSRVIKQKSGRLIVPLSEFENDGVQLTSVKGKIFYMYSDDNGMSWEKSEYLKPCGEDVTEQEPGIIELKDGALLCYVRTNKGSQFFAKSYDNGITWSDFKESTLISPLSPATIVQVQTGCKPLIAIYNNSTIERKPLTIALSYDGGESWINKKNITDLYSAYPSLQIIEDGEIIVGYGFSESFSGGLENYSIDRFKYIEN